MIIIPIVLIIVLASLLAMGNLLSDKSRHQIKGEVMRLFEKNGATQGEVLTEAEIEGLPDPVQRWLRYSQVIGKEKAITVRLRQGGFFRMKPDQGWNPLRAEEYYTTDQPAFVWHGRIALFPFVPIIVRDMYDDGKGQMLVKLLSLIKLVDVRDTYEINQGTLLRYLNEMMWFPSAALNDYIQWEAIDSTSATARMSYQGVTAEAVFHFNESGQLTNFVANRYREAGGEFILTIRRSQPPSATMAPSMVFASQAKEKACGIWIAGSFPISKSRLLKWNITSLQSIRKTSHS